MDGGGVLVSNLLFTEKQIRELHNNDVYKKHTGFLRSMEWSKNIIEDPQFNIEIDLVYDGTPLKELSLIRRILLKLFRYFYVLADLKRVRNKVIDLILDKRKDDSTDLLDYLNYDIKWLNQTSKMIENLRLHIIQFIDINDIKIVFYELANLKKDQEKTEFHNTIISRTNSFFGRAFDHLETIKFSDFLYDSMKANYKKVPNGLDAFVMNSLSGNMTGNTIFTSISEEVKSND
jgi:hypothetical protein